MRDRGFTLTETLIAVSIIAITATVAIPQYRRAVERGYWRTAQELLQTIYAGETVYESVNSTYVNPAGCAPAWRCIYMDDPTSPSIPVAYSVSGVSATTFTATATRKAGQFMTIDQNRALDTTSWTMP